MINWERIDEIGELLYDLSGNITYFGVLLSGKHPHSREAESSDIAKLRSYVDMMREWSNEIENEVNKFSN